ncbi:hypothetical protein TRVL_03525 [Trypanosoma vivax]|nr:hypothetical protein TRVL_03525 [Trypanosoma vivax]
MADEKLCERGAGGIVFWLSKGERKISRGNGLGVHEERCWHEVLITQSQRSLKELLHAGVARVCVEHGKASDKQGKEHQWGTAAKATEEASKAGICAKCGLGERNRAWERTHMRRSALPMKVRGSTGDAFPNIYARDEAEDTGP